MDLTSYLARSLAHVIGRLWGWFRAAPGLDTVALAAALPAPVQVGEPQPGAYLVQGVVDPQLLAALTGWCAARGVLAEDLRVQRRSLEDVFLELTGRDPR